MNKLGKSPVVEYLLANKRTILSLSREYNMQVIKVWNALIEKDPGIKDIMKINTFRAYFLPFVLIVKEFEYTPSRMSGWAIRLDEDRYYRGKKRMYGRLQSVYLGSVFNQDKFADKIDAKEERIIRAMDSKETEL